MFATENLPVRPPGRILLPELSSPLRPRRLARKHSPWDAVTILLPSAQPRGAQVRYFAGSIVMIHKPHTAGPCCVDAWARWRSQNALGLGSRWGLLQRLLALEDFLPHNADSGTRRRSGAVDVAKRGPLMLRCLSLPKGDLRHGLDSVQLLLEG